MNQTESSANENNPKPSITGETSAVPEWITETINGGSLRHVDLHTGINGWASPPGDVFSLRSTNYFTNKQKSPGGDYLLSPAGVDWLKSTTKLDNLLARPDNRVAHSLRQAQARGQSQNSFIFAVNFQVSGKEHYNLVFYFATEEPIPSDSVLKRFIDGDDTFRNQRLKLVSQIVKGPWIVKAAAGQFGAFLVGKTVSCTYHRGPNYFEIDVDTGSWAILSAFVRLLLGYARSFTVDVGLVIEAQTEDELPERLIGAVRMCHVELASAFVVQPLASEPCLMMGSAE
ncbi:protein ENHANCED DISEASE RESISTANCE 2-like [Brassica rapa]|uniref:Protein ENHANCED DISEASE RESISTANCE 2 C-terminal domain-containing protein n=1 Tax=Brassica campestris TaxID=3711 RepID=M4F620_BRACM|nr:protein ENHANCED DISEASE RESISTANCE 2-like [Brassica rapa]